MAGILVLPTEHEQSTAAPRAEKAIRPPQGKLPLLAHWAVKDVLPIASSTDLRNPDTSTWRKDTEDRDT